MCRSIFKWPMMIIHIHNLLISFSLSLCFCRHQNSIFGRGSNKMGGNGDAQKRRRHSWGASHRRDRKWRVFPNQLLSAWRRKCQWNWTSSWRAHFSVHLHAATGSAEQFRGWTRLCSIHGEGDTRSTMEVRSGHENGVHCHLTARHESHGEGWRAGKARDGENFLLLVLQVCAALGRRLAAGERIRLWPDNSTALWDRQSFECGSWEDQICIYKTCGFSFDGSKDDQKGWENSCWTYAWTLHAGRSEDGEADDRDSIGATNKLVVWWFELFNANLANLCLFQILVARHVHSSICSTICRSSVKLRVSIQISMESFRWVWHFL